MTPVTFGFKRFPFKHVKHVLKPSLTQVKVHDADVISLLELAIKGELSVLRASRRWQVASSVVGFRGHREGSSKHLPICSKHPTRGVWFASCWQQASGCRACCHQQGAHPTPYTGCRGALCSSRLSPLAGVGCRVHSVGFRVQGAGCRVQGAGCRV